MLTHCGWAYSVSFKKKFTIKTLSTEPWRVWDTKLPKTCPGWQYHKQILSNILSLLSSMLTELLTQAIQIALQNSLPNCNTDSGNSTYMLLVYIWSTEATSFLAIDESHVLLPCPANKIHVSTLILNWACPRLQQHRKCHNASNVCGQQHVPLLMMHELSNCWKPHPVAKGMYCHCTSQVSSAQENVSCIPTKYCSVPELEEHL